MQTGPISEVQVQLRCAGKRWFWLHSLRRLLHGTVGVEGLQLLLNSCQRVGEFPIVQHSDGLLDPHEQV